MNSSVDLGPVTIPLRIAQRYGILHNSACNADNRNSRPSATNISCKVVEKVPSRLNRHHFNTALFNHHKPMRHTSNLHEHIDLNDFNNGRKWGDKLTCYSNEDFDFRMQEHECLQNKQEKYNFQHAEGKNLFLTKEDQDWYNCDLLHQCERPEWADEESVGSDNDMAYSEDEDSEDFDRDSECRLCFLEGRKRFDHPICKCPNITVFDVFGPSDCYKDTWNEINAMLQSENDVYEDSQNEFSNEVHDSQNSSLFSDRGHNADYGDLDEIETSDEEDFRVSLKAEATSDTERNDDNVPQQLVSNTGGLHGTKIKHGLK